MSESTGKIRWPGETDEAHPEIFNTIPPQPDVLKPGQLSREKVEQFFNEGYLLIESFFKPEELDPAKEAINDLVDQLAEKLYKGGKIKDLYKDYGYHERLTKIDNDFSGANILLHKLGILPQAMRDIWSNERALNLAEQLLGTSDLAGHPVWNLRTKVPRADAATVPWHQDIAYLDSDSYKVFQLTAWIPLMDSDKETGCLQMIRCGQKSGKVARHVGCWRDTWYVMLEEDEIKNKLGCDIEKDVVTLPVPYGGLLLFSNMIPHRSLDNVSNKIRWSLDMRWQDANKPPGFYGLKDSVRMRSSTDPNFKINWDPFDSVDRHIKAGESVQAKEGDPFDTTIPGPWMKKWELVHRNRHTDAMEKSGGDSTRWHAQNLIVG